MIGKTLGMNRVGTALLAALAVALLPTPSEAVILTFTDLASWQTAVSTSTLEDFEGATADDDFTDTTTTSPNGDLELSSTEESTFSDNMLIDEASDGFESGSDFNGSDAHVSLRFLDKSPVPDSVTVAFPSGISAFALDFNNYDNQGDSVDFSFAGTNGGSLGTITPVGTSSPSTPNTGFFGMVDTDPGATVTSFTFSANPSIGDGSSVFFSFDNIRYGVAIPEPASVSLMLLFGIAVCGFRQK